MLFRSGIKGDLQEGPNRRGIRNLMRKATHRRVLIGIVHAALGEAIGETQAI